MTDLDLTPQRPDSAPSQSAALRKKLVVGVVCVVLGFVLFQAITNASVFFLNVDEAVEQRLDLEDRTFRMQGVVVSERSTDDIGSIVFTIAFNDVEAQIRHIGEEPTDLFELGMPVVVEGHWDGNTFESTQILIKHSETYIADNGERDGVGENGSTP